MASWAGCLAAMQEGVEPVMQLQCRDRNRIALQSDLLGAAALGIPNVLLLTGDHPRFGDHPDAKPVFDLDSIQLVWTARTMRDQRKLLSGRELKPAAALVHRRRRESVRAAAELPGRAAGQEGRGRRAVRARPSSSSTCALRRWMAAGPRSGLDERCSILAGVGPVKSLRALEHMRSEVPGMYVPDEVVRRLRGVPADRVAPKG